MGCSVQREVWMKWIVYGWCTQGIAISVLLPVLWEAVYRYFPRPQLAGPANVNNVPPALVALWRVVAVLFAWPCLCGYRVTDCGSQRRYAFRPPRCSYRRLHVGLNASKVAEVVDGTCTRGLCGGFASPARI